jgi:hypothetical protein
MVFAAQGQKSVGMGRAARGQKSGGGMGRAAEGQKSGGGMGRAAEGQKIITAQMTVVAPLLP